MSNDIEHTVIENHLDIEHQIDSIINNAMTNNNSISENNIQQHENLTQNVNDIDNQTNNNTMSEANVEVFNNAMHQYLRIDEEIKSLMEAVRARNQIKKQLAETITNFLRSNKIKKVDLDGSYKGKRLETNIKEVVSGFKKENVVSAIHEELKEDEEMFDKIMTALQRMSVMKEVCKLRIVQEKKLLKVPKKKQPTSIDLASAILDC